jgi:hypothetical protein
MTSSVRARQNSWACKWANEYRMIIKDPSPRNMVLTPPLPPLQPLSLPACFPASLTLAHNSLSNLPHYVFASHFLPASLSFCLCSITLCCLELLSSCISSSHFLSINVQYTPHTSDYNTMFTWAASQPVCTPWQLVSDANVGQGTYQQPSRCKRSQECISSS